MTLADQQRALQQERTQLNQEIAKLMDKVRKVSAKLAEFEKVHGNPILAEAQREAYKARRAEIDEEDRDADWEAWHAELLAGKRDWQQWNPDYGKLLSKQG